MRGSARETALSLFKLRPNQFPVVCANLNVLKQSAIERFSIDMNAVNRHMAWLSEHASDLVGPISLSSEHEPEKGADADCALYEGFTSNADRAMMQRAESLSPEALTEAVGEGRIHFEDPRLTELLWRKRARNWPGALTDDERIRWKAFCGARLQGLVPGTLSLAEYMNEVDAAADTDCQALEAGQMTEDQFEARQQILEREGKLPSAVLACVGGGSNAMGMFYHFIGDKDVKLIGCEAAGKGIDTKLHAATIAKGEVGIFHGMKSIFCQNEDGQIDEVYSISAGLDYPGIGPEHAYLHQTGRAQYVPVKDDEAVEAFEYLARTEGIICAIESAHAVYEAMQIAPKMSKDDIIIVCLSGRGDKDVAAIARYKGRDLHE